jgi:AraC family transcriptional regulator of adaptative response / methylphosphotriester-DNA alkyltransferase methyltransferase
VRASTLNDRQRLYLLARVIVARHYRRSLTLAVVASALSTSPRQLQRAYAQFGDTTFQEDLLARRMAAAAQLLIEQRAISVRDVARLVGYRQAPHFAGAFRRRYGLSPARFREQAPRRAEQAPRHDQTPRRDRRPATPA